MWTPAARAQLARRVQPYATCLTDAEWMLVEPFLPDPARTGRPRSWLIRRVVDAVLYGLRTGCAWAHLPRKFPPSGTVLRWFLRLSRSNTFERLAHALTMADRERTGREASPTAAMLDAQSVRSGGVGVKSVRSYDAGKKVMGRRRRALMDTDGRLLLEAVSHASLHDSRGGAALLAISRRPWPFLACCFADRAYAGPRVAGASPVAVNPRRQHARAEGLRRAAQALGGRKILRLVRLMPTPRPRPRSHRQLRRRLLHPRRRHDPRPAIGSAVMKWACSVERLRRCQRAT